MEPTAAEALALAVAETPAPAVRQRVLDAARAARPAGQPIGSTEASTAVDAFRRTLADMGALLDSLGRSDAAAPTIEGWTVTGLVGHLTAIDDHFGAVLGWWPETGPLELEHDHLAMTLPAVAIAHATPFVEVRDRWHAMAARMGERLDSLDARLTERVLLHGFDFSVRSLLIARTFEVWTHTEDISRAVGRPAPELDAARLRLMTAAVVGALPLGMILTGGEPQGRSVRIVLEGEGGGAWVQSLEVGGVPGEPALTLVADAVDFCRVAAKRVAGADLRCTVLGDTELAGVVLTAAALFAA